MTNIFHLQALLLISFSFLSHSEHTLFSNQSLSPNQTLISEKQRFELGFFTPQGSSNTYLGIWYNNISPRTVVWVANRNSPLPNSSGVLKMDENGYILLLDGSNGLVWSSNMLERGNPIVGKPVAKLLDTGNLVVTEESDGNRYRWQSFDHATDTLLPGMKLGWDLDVGLNNSLIAWKSVTDPSVGRCSLVASSNAPEMYLLDAQKPLYRSGLWNGKQFSGVPEMEPRDGDGIKFSFVYNGNRNYYSFEVNDFIISRLVVDVSCKLKRLIWLGDQRHWRPYWDAPKDHCDRYKECGAYGICDINDSPVCNCMKGFEPRNKKDWRYRDGSGGCIWRKEFECGKDDGFRKLENIKLPDCSKTYYRRDLNLKQCKEMCRKNCSCTAYASLDISNGGTGCIIWIGELFDIKFYVNAGQDLYVRLAASELDHNHKSIAIIIIIIVVVIFVASLSILTAYFIWKKKKRIPKRLSKKRVNRVKSQETPLFDMVIPTTGDVSEELKDENIELPVIDFDTIAAITDNFSDSNKLGEGGFGSVYKGTLEDGQQVAVKRLSKNSGQGVEEFKNELMLIAKLQHRNLVRLLGCCIDGEEKMLIYEYMPNKSLDSFLFDATKSSILDWGKRFNIIRRIARGLLYLHQDSRFRIIHRDLKASNILLDAEMNPKISDFGMARIFGGDETEGNTSRVVGTYGYMSPEYAMDGVFSVKSDVFSYGVLVLEIISGKRNRGFFVDSDELNLLGYAWRLWQEGNVLDLIDPSMGETFSKSEVLKCVQVGLLCVQEHAEDRPTIACVLVMLCSEIATLPQPKQPGFTVRRVSMGANSSSKDQETCSINEVTVTTLEPR